MDKNIQKAVDAFNRIYDYFYENGYDFGLVEAFDFLLKEAIDISSRNLDSSLCFIQPTISHNAFSRTFLSGSHS